MLISLHYSGECEPDQRPGYRVRSGVRIWQGEKFFFLLPHCILLAQGSTQPQWAAGEPLSGTKWSGPVPSVYTTRRYICTFPRAMMTWLSDTVQLHQAMRQICRLIMISRFSIGGNVLSLRFMASKYTKEF